MTDNRLATAKRLTLHIAFLLILILSSTSAFGMFMVAPELVTGTEVDVKTFEVADSGIWFNITEDGDTDPVLSEKYLEDSKGEANAYASLQATGIMPVLKAEAYHNLDGTESAGAYARAYAMEGYKYSGETKQIKLTAILTGDVFEPEGSYSMLTGITASMYVYGENNSIFDGVNLRLSESVTGGMDTAYIEFTVNDGDIFYLEGVLESYGILAGSYADAFSTLNFEFDSTDGLTALSRAAAVPIPGSMLLLVSGMVCVVGFGRRFKRD